jgi:Reverse transcriptase (RNA-dependent DNA polymerase)
MIDNNISLYKKEWLITEQWRWFNENNKMIDISLSSEYFEELNLEREHYYVSFSQNHRIGGTCWRPCSNIRNFEILKGNEDALLAEYNINTTQKLTKEEFLTFIKPVYKFEDNKDERDLLFQLVRSGEFSIGSSWIKIEDLDYMLKVESLGFIEWVKYMDDMSRSSTDVFNHEYYKSILSDNYPFHEDEISEDVNDYYWHNFESTLKTRPYLWISSLNNWQKDYIYEENFTTLLLPKFVSDLLQNKTHQPLQNVWVESPKGKWRMLSVPNYRTRWICRLWNEALSNYVYRKIHRNYHGFIHNRGVLSWWTMFLKGKYYSKYEYIYEFDMASFFPNVNRSEGLNALKYYGVPTKYAIHLINLVSGECKSSKTYPNEESFYEETLNKEWAKGDRNLPMGNALCPLISSLVLYKHFTELGFNEDEDMIITGYADDNSIMLTSKGYRKLQIKLGINVNVKIEEYMIRNYLNNDYKGIYLEPEKSGWVKYNDQWLKSYKNLGMLYQPFSEINGQRSQGHEIYAKTRGTKHGPSNLKFELKNKINNKLLNLKELLKDKILFNKYFGLIQSRLFQNGWNPEYPQDFSLKALGPKTLGRKVYNKYEVARKEQSIFNMTSYCNAFLMRHIMGKDFGINNEIIPDATELKLTGNLTKFMKYKEMKSKISELKFHEKYGYHLWISNYDNNLYDIEKEEEF